LGSGRGGGRGEGREKGREGTFFTGGVEVEAFEEVVHCDALALGRTGLLVLELSGRRGLLLAAVMGILVGRYLGSTTSPKFSASV